MKCVCVVIMWSLKTRIEESFSYSYSNRKSPINAMLCRNKKATFGFSENANVWSPDTTVKVRYEGPLHVKRTIQRYT